MPKPPHPADIRAAPERLALAGVAINAGLAIGKLAAGIFGHSFALVADAAESLVDIASSVIVWGALRYGARPPDEDHPFGHGKIEALAGLAVAGLIVAVGVGIGLEAIRHIVTPHPGPRAFTLAVVVGVVVIKETLARIASSAAKRAGSSAGMADAWHHRADAITSGFAFIGIAIALIGGPAWAVADDWAALLASGVIVLNGIWVAREPFAELMDRHAPDIAEQAQALALEIDGIEGVEYCGARRSGRGYRVVMHAEVDPQMTVADSHRLTGVAKSVIRDRCPLIDSVLIHIEPAPRPAPSSPGAP